MHLNSITKSPYPEKADGLLEDLATLQAFLDVISTVLRLLKPSAATS